MASESHVCDPGPDASGTTYLDPSGDHVAESTTASACAMLVAPEPSGFTTYVAQAVEDVCRKNKIFPFFPGYAASAVGAHNTTSMTAKPNPHTRLIGRC
jgi:hypothetical protein